MRFAILVALTPRHHGEIRTVAASHVVCATGGHTHARLEPLLRRCRTERPARRAAVAVAGGDGKRSAVLGGVAEDGRSVAVVVSTFGGGAGPREATIAGFERLLTENG